MSRSAFFRNLLIVSGAFSLACASVPHPSWVSVPHPDLTHPHSQFADADDGPHPSKEPAYFEWWYYDVTFEDGTSATVALYSASMFGENGPPGVLVNVLDLAGRAHTSYQSFDKSQLRFGAPGEVTVGTSSVTRDGVGQLHLSAVGVEAGVPLWVDLHFTATMPGFKLGTGEVRFEDKIALGWVVPMPRAAVEGTIRIGDVTRTLKGFGYHDHNWGELSVLTTMGYWYWGRVAAKDLTAVYTNLVFREETGLPPLRILVAGDEKEMKQVVLNVNIEPFAEKVIDDAARDVPGGLAIEGGGAKLRLTERKVVDATDLSLRLGPAGRFFSRFFTRPAYVRTLCDYQWTSTLDGLPSTSEGAALVEYMYVWKR